MLTVMQSVPPKANIIDFLYAVSDVQTLFNLHDRLFKIQHVLQLLTGEREVQVESEDLPALRIGKVHMLVRAHAYAAVTPHS